MKIAELYEFHRFRFAEAPIEPPGPGEVQVRVRAVGICGSDVHNFTEGSVGDQPTLYPMVIGHEPTGEIVKLGPGASGVSIGDKAVLEPAHYCYHCEFCLSGRHNVCSHLKFLSTPGNPGFFREFVNLPLTNVLPVPKGLTLAQATLFEPMAIILHSINLGQFKFGETVAVFGAGPIGLCTIVGLKLAGAKRIWSIEPLAHRGALAKELGADVVINPNETDPVQEIMRDTGKRGVDIAFDCATKNGSINQAIDVTRNAGRTVITGIPSEVETFVNVHTLRRKEVTLYNVRRSNHETEMALEIMEEHPKACAALVTHTRPLDEIQSSFEMLERYEDGVAKVVLTL